MADVPEYYRQFATKPKPPAPPPAAPPAAPQPAARMPLPAAPQPSRAPAPQPTPVLRPATVYLANTFSLGLAEEWEDRTLHTISGPVDDGIQHNILVDVEPEVDMDDLHDYADRQVAALETGLKSCRVLLKETVQLANGLPAYRAIFCWHPTDDLRLYQEQVYVLSAGFGYKLTATFTKKTRKTLGPLVERMMLTFTPGPPASGPPAGSPRY